MLLKKTREAPASEYGGWHRVVHVTRPGVPPGTATVVGRGRCTSLTEPERTQLLKPSAWTLPLLPQNATQSSTYPRIQFFEACLDSRPSEVRDPPPNDGGELLNDATEMTASAPS